MIAKGNWSDRRRKQKRKVFSWLMVLCMVLTLFSTQFAAADDTSEAADQTTVTEDVTVDTETNDNSLPAGTEEGNAGTEEVIPVPETVAPIPENARQVTKAAEETNTETPAVPASDAADEEISTYYSADLNQVSVQVETQQGAFDESVRLVVKELPRYSEGFKEAEQALAKEKQKYDGMLAYDIHFESIATGAEIEPNGDVSVKMTAKQKSLASIDTESFNESSVKVVHIGDAKTEVVADTSGNGMIKGMVSVNANDEAVKEIKADFKVDSFSTFVLTWGEGTQATVHFGKMNGTTFEEFEETEIAFDTTAASISLENSFEGYYFRDAVYCTEGQAYEDGVEINSVLHKTSTGWECTQYTTGEDETTVETTAPVANGSHIYVIYYKPEPGQEHASGADDTSVPSPETSKVVTPNEDGTYTIQLDVTGAVVPDDHSHYANVMIILDRTRSMNGSKWTNAKQACVALVDALTTGDNAGNAGKIDFCLVGFGRDGQILTGSGQNSWGTTWTKDNAKFRAYINSNALGMVSTSGTNWEAGMRAGKAALAQVPDNDPTYVIFVTDGDPNVYYSSGSADNYSDTGTTPGYNQNSSTSANAAKDEAQTIASSTSLYGIFCFEGNTVPANLNNNASYRRLNDVITGQGQGGKKTIAAVASTIQSEFELIAQTIIDELGASNVSVDDGVPSLSSVSATVSGEASGFEYYKKRVNESDFTAWTGAPGASYSQDNGVTWDISEAGTLEEGTTYRLKFKVWPSQEALDLIADLNNGLQDYDDLDEVTQSYITGSKEAGYTLKTNTHLATSYTFKGQTYTDPADWTPAAMDLPTKTIRVKKEWHNVLDERSAAPVSLSVMKGDEVYIPSEVDESGNPSGKVVVSNDNGWTSDPIYISCGFITQSTEDLSEYEILEPGHDYSVGEPENFAYYWHLSSEVYRPMVINGQDTMLIKDADATGTEGVDYYVLDGEKYKVSDDDEFVLKAVNDRRSYLDLTKAIQGTNPDPDQLFEFTITIGEEGGEAVWFDAQATPGDDSTIVKDLTVSNNVTPEMRDGEPTGYYSVPAGTEFTVQLKAGWGLRFINMPTGTAYEIEETNLPESYEFVKAEATADRAAGYQGDADEPTPGTVTDMVVSGTIDQPNAAYAVEYTNKPNVVDAVVTKTFSGNDGNLPEGFVINVSYKNANGNNATKTLTLDDQGALQDDGSYKWIVTGVQYGSTMTATESNTTIPGYVLSDDAVETGSVEVGVDIDDNVVALNNPYELDTYDMKVVKTFSGIEADEVPALFEVVVKEGDKTIDTLKTTDTDVVKSADGLTYTWTVEDVTYKANVTATESGETVEGYTLDGENAVKEGNVTIGIDESKNVINLSNPYDINSYSMKVVKTFSGIEADEVPANFEVAVTADGEEFKTLKTTDQGVEKSTDGLTFTWTIENVPYKTEVTATESNETVIGHTLGQAVKSGTITIDTDATKNVINLSNPYDINSYDMTVVKTFSGIEADEVPANFQVAVTADGEPLTTLKTTDQDVEKTSDGLTFKWTIKNVPYKTDVTATESGETVDGYVLKNSAVKEGEITIGTVAADNKIELSNPYDLDCFNMTVVKTFSGIEADEVPADFEVAVKDGDTTIDTLTIAEAEKSEDGLTFTWTVEDVTYKTEVTATESNETVDGYTLDEDAAVKTGDVTIGTDESKNVIELSNPYDINSYDMTVVKTFSGIEASEVPEDFEVAVTAGDETLATLKTTDADVKKSEDGLTFTWTVEDVTYKTEVTATESGEAVDGYTLDEDAAVKTGDVTIGSVVADNKIELSNPYDINGYDMTVVKTFEGIEADEVPADFEVAVTAGDETLATLKTTDADVKKSEDGLTFTWTVEDVTYKTEVTATESGETVTGYTLDEAKAVKEGEVTIGTVVADNKIELSNPYDINEYDVTVTKTFGGEINKDLIPENFAINVSYDNAAHEDEVLNAANATKVSEDGMTYTWTLKDITYKTTISYEEVNYEIPGYTRVDGDTSGTLKVSADPEENAFALINDYTQNWGEDVVNTPTLSIVKKDKNDVTLAGATFTLTSEDGKYEVAHTTQADGKATFDFSGFEFPHDADTNYADTEFKFTLTETAPTGYVAAGPWTVTVKEDDGTYYVSEVGEYEEDAFTKVWDWVKVAFTGEEGDDSYTFSVDEATNAASVIIMNEREKVNVPVEKVWEKEDPKYDIRPESITVNLLADGKATEKSLELSDENEWKDTFVKLDKYSFNEKGEAIKEIDYTVDEVDVAGYKTEISGDAVEGYIITNTMKFGDVRITKDLKTYETSSEKATFVYSVKATVKVGKKNVTVYDGVVTLDFTSATTASAVIEHLPAGAVVEVEETYSGAAYDQKSGPDWDVDDQTIKADEEIGVEFSNAYNGELTQGYGILNEYEAEDGSWVHLDEVINSNDEGKVQ